SNHRRSIPSSVFAHFRKPADGPRRIRELFEEIRNLLGTELLKARYIGPVGIDAFVYRSRDGSCRLKPVVEVNPRYTMGRLTVELMKNVCPGSSGFFRLINLAGIRAEGFEDFAAYANAMKTRFPLLLKGEPRPRIQEGVICLNDPERAQACLAFFR